MGFTLAAHALNVDFAVVRLAWRFNLRPVVIAHQLHLYVSVSGMTANRFRPCQPNVAVQQGAVFTFRFTALWNSFSWRDFECVRFMPVSNFVGVVSAVAQMGLLFISAFIHGSLRDAFILMVSRVVVSTSVASPFQWGVELIQF